MRRHFTPVLLAAATACAVAYASEASLLGVVAAGLVTAVGVWALVWAADRRR